MRDASSWFGSTVGPRASAARTATVPRSRVTVGTTPSRTGRYRCVECGARFDDLTGTVLAGRHRPLRLQVLRLYPMGLNLSNRQIARELDLCVSDVQAMAEALRHGLTAKLPPARLEGAVEIDEVYVVAGHRDPHRRPGRLTAMLTTPKPDKSLSRLPAAPPSVYPAPAPA
jgi:transposase-like protein